MDTVEYHSAIKKNEILIFAATWLDLEGITLSEITQTETDKPCEISLMCEIHKTKPNPQIRRTDWWLPEERQVEG